MVAKYHLGIGILLIGVMLLLFAGSATIVLCNLHPDGNVGAGPGVLCTVFVLAGLVAGVGSMVCLAEATEAAKKDDAARRKP